MEILSLLTRVLLLGAALLILLFLYRLLRERPLRRSNVLFIEVGSPYVSLLPQARSPRRLSPLSLALAVVVVSLAALLVVSLFPVLLALGAPILLVVAVALLAYALSRTLSRPVLMLRSVLISVARDRECDLFIPYRPPATSEEEWDVSLLLKRWIAREGLPSLAVISVPKTPDWWSVTATVSRTLRSLKIPVAHIYIADHRVTAYSAELAFLDSLVGDGGFVLWGDFSAVLPSAELQESRSLAEAVLSTVVGILAEYSRTGLAEPDRYSYDQSNIISELEDRVHVIAMLHLGGLVRGDLAEAFEVAPRVLLNSVWLRELPWTAAEKAMFFLVFPSGFAPRQEHVRQFENGLVIALDEHGISLPRNIRVSVVQRELDGPVVLGLISLNTQALAGLTPIIPKRADYETLPREAIEVMIQ